jgi:hypothetical protein
MKRFWLGPLAAAAVAGGLAMANAQALPVLDSLKLSASEQGVTEQVHRRWRHRHRHCHRRCWWHRGHRHCRRVCHR